MSSSAQSFDPRLTNNDAALSDAASGRCLSGQLESLGSVLHRLRIAAIIAEAETVRNWPSGSERLHEAAKLIRQAMYLQTIGQLSQAEESQVFTILAFAMPADGNAGW